MNKENEILKNLKEINERQKEKEYIYSYLFKTIFISALCYLIIISYIWLIKPSIANYKINKNAPNWVENYKEKKIIKNKNTYVIRFKYNATTTDLLSNHHISHLKIYDENGKILIYDDIELNINEKELKKKIDEKVEFYN
ncbi:hypothetical protein [Clostridium botulinum]|uniref:hypothetical protein n=1 Tax=Clostridium botulinum TaxID=1491 RepID=UPI0004D00C01|nr:hypothetical protein [Clostridium botulinum]APC82254.1 hypothetical protein NPD12_3722 [Clostridium botulinum]AXG97777.1 hypothetical protein AGE31_19505 [Clostridium botulinum]MBY6773578.1 hypothetical protein [Clostridium botulinum]MBY6886003.1 hypothetical protein [Clostridium botulinum]